MKLPDLIRRQMALRKTQAKFAGKRFKIGTCDCVQVARFHAVAMGHKRLPATGKYSTPAGAGRALLKTGHRDLASLLDSLFEPIAPAAALPGDFLMPPSDPDAPASEIGTVMVKIERKALGWHPDFEQFAVMDLTQIDRAWRV